MTEQAMRIDFYEYGLRFPAPPGHELDALHQFEDQLIEIIETAGVGEVDGREIAIDYSHGIFFLYGPDALAMFGALEDVLRKSDLTRDAVVTLRFGDVDDLDASVTRIDLADETGSN